jgi:hypothetical protein
VLREYRELKELREQLLEFKEHKEDKGQHSTEYRVHRDIKVLRDHKGQQDLLALRDHKELYKVLRVVKVIQVLVL